MISADRRTGNLILCRSHTLYRLSLMVDCATQRGMEALMEELEGQTMLSPHHQPEEKSIPP